MIVVHAFVTPAGQVALWAEATPVEDPCQAGTGGRTMAQPSAARVHPFATLPPVPGAVDTATLLLPSRAHGPLASPGLGPDCTCDGAVQTLPWTVAVVRPEPGADL